MLMFAVGWIVGPIRELWAVPHFGRVEATVVEAIIMLIAMVVAARWAIRRFEVPHTFASTLSMGLISIGLLFPAEIAGIVWVRRLSVQEYAASLVTIPGIISLRLLLFFTAIPIVVGRLIPARFEHDEFEEVDPWITDRWDVGMPVTRAGIGCGFGGTYLGGSSISASLTRDRTAKRRVRGIAGIRALKKSTAVIIAR
jgi:hypothetical protein